jgi:hypothetical protein
MLTAARGRKRLLRGEERWIYVGAPSPIAFGVRHPASAPARHGHCSTDKRSHYGGFLLHLNTAAFFPISAPYLSSISSSAQHWPAAEVCICHFFLGSIECTMYKFVDL